MTAPSWPSRKKPSNEWPLIAVTPRLGVDLVPSLPNHVRTFRYAIVTGSGGTRYFSASGLCHRVSRLVTEKPLSLLERALAATIYNPWIDARVEYDAPRPYEIDELRALLVEAVKDDDDILTQWREKSDLLDKLTRARTYGHLVDTLRFAGLRLET